MENAEASTRNCPICRRNNRCEIDAADGCWCHNVIFPAGIFELVPKELVGKSCICKDCFNEYNRGLRPER